MRLLFVSNYFPPEVNAPATRLYEHARQWAADGHDVHVLTSVPNFPEGRVYEGYTNRYVEEDGAGIRVARVPVYLAENKGLVKRTLSYLSFLASALWYSRRIRMTPDVVVATSPQFLAAIAGYLIAVWRRLPFVLEIRDLWPDSIVAVGAVKPGRVIRLLESLERFLYRRSDHIVVVTEAFKRHVVAKGIRADKVSVIKNGFDLESLDTPLDPTVLGAICREYDIQGKFVASYIGTIGMAHGVEVMLEAARICDDPDVVFMVVGTGAERESLQRRYEEAPLPNFRLVGKQPKDRASHLLALSSLSVVHLRDSPLFRTVIPSKIFEAMAARKPIVLGVEGEAKEMVESSGCGVAVRPEDARSLVDAVRRLKMDSETYVQMGLNGLSYVTTFHDRRRLARDYADILSTVVHWRKALGSVEQPSGIEVAESSTLARSPAAVQGE